MSKILIIIKDLAPVQVDNAIHWIKDLYPVDSAIGLPNTYPLDSDPYQKLFCPYPIGSHFLTFEQPGCVFDEIIHEILCFAFI